MKKGIIFSFLFVLISIAAFAQFEFGGAIQTGVINNISEDNNALIIASWNQMAHNRLKFFTNYTKDNYGACISIQHFDGIFGFGYAYGWATIKDMIKIKAGKIEDEEWSVTLGDLWFDNANDVGEGWGALFQLMPLEGLNFGFGVYAKDDFDGNGFSSYTTPEKATYTFGAAYNLPRVLKVSGSGKITDGEFTKVFGGLSVFPFGLPLFFTALSTNLDDNNPGWQFAQAAMIALGPFGGGLRAFEGVNRAVENIGGVLYATGGYSFGIALMGFYTLNKIIRFAGGVKYTTVDEKLGDESLITLNPSITYLLAQNINIGVGYAFKYLLNLEQTTHVMYLDFSLTF